MKSDALIAIGLEADPRAKMAKHLSTLLADQYVLYVKTQKFHWNVVGKHFGPLHLLFNQHYDELAEFVDIIAERIRALGYQAIGTLEEFGSLAKLKEAPGINPADLEMVRILLQDHEHIIRTMRTYIDYSTEINDMATNNMLADMLEKQEKMAWMLRAHLLGA